MIPLYVLEFSLLEDGYLVSAVCCVNVVISMFAASLSAGGSMVTLSADSKASSMITSMFELPCISSVLRQRCDVSRVSYCSYCYWRRRSATALFLTLYHKRRNVQANETCRGHRGVDFHVDPGTQRM